MNSELNIELQAVFKGVDETILNLNPILKNDGYEFVSIGMTELESQYGRLFNIPENLIPSSFVKFENGDQVSAEFYNLLKEQPFYKVLNLINQSRVFHLRRIGTAKLTIRNGVMNISEIFPEVNELDAFVDKLIKKFWYFKSGAVTSPLSFAISLEDRHVVTKFQVHNHIYANKPYTLNAQELNEFESYYLEDVVKLDMLKLPMKYFESCYSTNDEEVKFMNLIMALESIFNRGASQISHTVSRHLALIVSSSKHEFSERYREVKKLYDTRSKIVHGQSESPRDLAEKVEVLESLIRKAIHFCSQAGMSKSELFDYLNAKGFSDS